MKTPSSPKDVAWIYAKPRANSTFAFITDSDVAADLSMFCHYCGGYRQKRKLRIYQWEIDREEQCQ